MEWSARQALSQGKSLLQRSDDTLFGQWPWHDPQSMTPKPEIPGLS